MKKEKASFPRKPSELQVQKAETIKGKTEFEKRESPSIDQDQSYEHGVTKAQRDHKRVLITGVNSLVGHGLFEQMRNDHLVIHENRKADKFMGTLIQKD